MKNLLLSAVALMVCMPAIAQESNAYLDMKENLANNYGISYEAYISELAQRGAPNGKQTAFQTYYAGQVGWDMFESNTFGAGSVNFSYIAIRYQGMNATNLGERIGVVTPVNDYPEKANAFYNLTYTHQMPGVLDDFSATLGQFTLYDVDGTTYNNDQALYFINYALSQNGSAVYPNASLGGYVTYTPTDEWRLIAGAQNTDNIEGVAISWNKFKKGHTTSFVHALYSPEINGLPGQYGVLLYNQPGVDIYPKKTNGWSFNAEQFVSEKVAVFANVNGTSKENDFIKQSYAAGVVWNDPYGRSELDQIGAAAAINKLSRNLAAEEGLDIRSAETVFEGYMSFGFFDFIILTPDVQFYLNPGLDKDHRTATVVSLRATLCL